jgi:hypothetical protein
MKSDAGQSSVVEEDRKDEEDEEEPKSPILGRGGRRQAKVSPLDPCGISKSHFGLITYTLTGESQKGHEVAWKTPLCPVTVRSCPCYLGAFYSLLSLARSILLSH